MKDMNANDLRTSGQMQLNGGCFLLITNFLLVLFGISLAIIIAIAFNHLIVPYATKLEWLLQQHRLDQEVAQLIDYQTVWYDPYEPILTTFGYMYFIAFIVGFIAIIIGAWKSLRINKYSWYLVIGGGLILSICGKGRDICTTQAVYFGKKQIAIVNDQGQINVYNRDSLVYEDYIWKPHGFIRYKGSKHGSNDVYAIALRDIATDKEVGRIYFDIYLNSNLEDNKSKPSLSELPSYAIKYDYQAVKHEAFKLRRACKGPTKRISSDTFYYEYYKLPAPNDCDLRSFYVVWPESEKK